MVINKQIYQLGKKLLVVNTPTRTIRTLLPRPLACSLHCLLNKPQSPTPKYPDHNYPNSRCSSPRPPLQGVDALFVVVFISLVRFVIGKKFFAAS